MLANFTPHDAERAETVGTLLVRLRTGKGYTQQRLAAELCDVSGSPTVSRYEIARWERGRRIPGRFWRRWLAVVLEAPPEQLEAAVDATRARHRHRKPAAQPARRHRLWQPVTAGDLLTVLDEGGTHDLPGLAHEWLVGPTKVIGLALDPQHAGWMPGPGDRTGPELLAGLQTRLCRLRRADDVIGGLDLAGRVHRELRDAISALRMIGNGYLRPSAMRPVAGYAQLAGWVHADAGDYAAARRAYRVALQTAAIAGDRELAGYVLASLSHQSVTAEHPREALLLARTGLQGNGTGGSVLIRALLLHREALAAAHLGEPREAELALVNAERALDQVKPDEEPAWLYWLDEGELAAMTGRCLAVLGRPARAVRLLRARHRHASSRTDALYDGWLAYSYVQLGEVEQAGRVATRALADAAACGSARAGEALRQLRPVLMHSGKRATKLYAFRAERTVGTAT